MFPIESGAAVYQDFPIAIIERARRCARTRKRCPPAMVHQYRFTLYEYFITDKIGHAQDFGAARTTLQALAKFIRELLGRVDLDRTSVILTSDHGNIEDLSSRNHTLNKVPTIVWGPHRHQIVGWIQNLADITPAIVSTLTNRARSASMSPVLPGKNQKRRQNDARESSVEDVRLG